MDEMKGRAAGERDRFRFETLWTDGLARTGRIIMPSGVVQTPAFVAVGTQAAVKSLDPTDLRASGQSMIFANTYHLYLRPGADVIADLGGIHKFMGWDGPCMTDSGGFQVFSLGAGIEHGVGKIASMFPGESAARSGSAGKALMRIDEDGVSFSSHLDGSEHRLTPERSIEIQRQLGADIILAFDECTSPLHDHAYTAAAMERTHRWAQRSLEAFARIPPPHGARQALYGITQGGWFEDLRRQSTAAIGAMPFDGIAIGGSLGRTKADMADVLEWSVPMLPPDRPRHLLGIGEIPDIFMAVARGIDTFDCVSPTRMARNAGLIARTLDGALLPRQRMNLRNARYARDPAPVVDDCPCMLCTHFSRAYLHHLFRSKELLAHRLATLHNLTQINRVMASIRSALEEGTFQTLRQSWLGSDHAEGADHADRATASPTERS